MLDKIRNKEAESQDEQPSSGVYKIVCIILIILILLVIAAYFIFHPRLIIGPSMEPTYHNLQIVSTDVSFTRDDITYNTIVFFKSPEDSRTLVKRVVGLPGDTVEVKKDGAYVNGVKFDDRKTEKTAPAVVLGPDEYYCLGDNRDNSKDSRDFGAVKYKKIKCIK